MRAAFPDMKGFSPRNLKYMRAFAEAWPDAEFVQEVLAQLPWYHQLALLDKLADAEARRWYAAKSIEHNWSRNILVMQIETRLLKRSGTAVTNFEACLPIEVMAARGEGSRQWDAVVPDARNGRTVERPRRCGLHSNRVPDTDEHVVYALVGACHDQRPAQRV